MKVVSVPACFRQRCEIASLGSQLEDRAASMGGRALEVAAEKRGSVEVAVGIEDGGRIGIDDIVRLAAERVEDFLRARRGQLEHCARVVSAAEKRGSVEVAVGIEDHARCGILPSPVWPPKL